MGDTYSQSFTDLLAETEPYMDHIDDLQFDVAAELYDLLDDAAKAATLQIWTCFCFTGCINNLPVILRRIACCALMERYTAAWI